MKLQGASARDLALELVSRLGQVPITKNDDEVLELAVELATRTGVTIEELLSVAGVHLRRLGIAGVIDLKKKKEKR